MKEILDMTCGGRMIWYQPQIFKWSDEQIPVQKILKVINFQPLLGDRRGKTRWLVFYKFQDGEEQNVTQ